MIASTRAYKIEEVSDEDFLLFSRLILEQSGINLEKSKRALLNARLGRRVRLLGLNGFREYFDLLQQNDGEMTHMLDAISTNHTEFFREPAHFEFLLSKFFPRVQNERSIRILSAGCSTGEEAYSIALCAHKYFGNAANQKVAVIACDISSRALSHAKTGVYLADRVRLVPRAMADACLSKVSAEGADYYHVRSEIRGMVDFQRANLAGPAWFAGHFNAIFCRNVVIYFNPATQNLLFKKLYDSLQPGGNLFVGHSESMFRSGLPFKFVQPTVYERLPASGSAS